MNKIHAPLNFKDIKGGESVSLGNGFYFEWGNPLFLKPEGSLNGEFLGSELCHGQLRHNLIPPEFDVTFLPVTSSLPSAVLWANLSKLSFATEMATTAHLDWPEEFAAFLAEIHKSYLYPLAVVPKNVRNAGTTLYQLEENSGNLLWLVEPQDARTMFVCLFPGARPGLELNILGTEELSLAKKYAQNILEFSLPQETLLQNGLLPWWQALLAPAYSESTLETAFIRLLHKMETNKHSRHLLLMKPQTMLAFAKYLQEKEVWSSGTKVIAKDFPRSASLSLCKIEPKSALEHGMPGAFFIAELIDLLSKKDYPFFASWQDFTTSALANAFRNCRERYLEWTKIDITEAQHRDFFRFSAKLAVEGGRLFPSTIDFLLSANSVIDSNFSFEFLKECENYFGNEFVSHKLGEVSLPLESFMAATRTITIEHFSTLNSAYFFNRKPKALQSKTADFLNLGKSPVPEEKYLDNKWATETHPFACSFPDEDIFMEDFAFHYREQASIMLKAKENHVHELSSSFCDGLDIRETVRNWYQEKIFVSEEIHTGKSNIGAVVFQFVPEIEEEKYSWLSYWTAEKHDKSDLMFFATPYANNIIGPGIAKSDFGGFATIPLPNYLTNPWTNPVLMRLARNRGETLLLAAAVSTEHKAVLYIGVTPPSQNAYNLVKRSGKNIVYLNIDLLPQDKIRKIRTFHILAEAGVRAYAGKYIRKDY